MLKGLTEVFLNQGYDMLVRDNSYLGFPSAHVITPGYSELHSYDALKMRQCKTFDSAKEILRNIHQAGDEDLEKLIMYIKFTLNSSMENNTTFLYNVPVHTHSLNDGEAYRLIPILAYYKMGKIEEALACFESMLAVVSQLNDRTLRNRVVYYRCARDFIRLRKESWHIDEIEKLLLQFYSENTIRSAIEDFQNPSRVFCRFFKRVNCWNCQECESRNNCAYEKVEALYLKVKEKMKANPIDQMRLKRALDYL